MTTLPLPADTAQWIRDTALPATYQRSVGNLDTCPCQGSASGHCQAGNCGRCPRTWGWHRHGQPTPDTYIVSHTGSALTAVWRTGRPCRWLCPCPCHTAVHGLFAAPTAGPRRPPAGLRIISTDRLTAFDATPPALFTLEDQ